MRTILVTGGAGHVGSHLIELLVAGGGARVISLDNYFNGTEANHIAGAEYRRGHTKDIDTLVPETPDIVFHLGEYARIAPSFEDVALVHDMNTTGTFAVAEFCRTRGVGKLVYSASSTKFAVEGEGRNQSPYAFSKAQNVDLLNNYGAWFGLSYAICYFYNAYGPRERADDKYGTVIANFEKRFGEGRPLRVVSPGTQRRAFTHVKDLARGILLVGERGQGDGYALGCEESYSILEIAEAFGAPYEVVHGNPGRDASHNDASKARQELGWSPEVRVLDYIRDFVASHPRR